MYQQIDTNSIHAGGCGCVRFRRPRGTRPQKPGEQEKAPDSHWLAGALSYTSTSFRAAGMAAVSAALLLGAHFPESLRVCSFHLLVLLQ